MASKLNPKSLMTVMTMTVITTFNKNWALRANRGVVVLAAPLQLVVVGCSKIAIK